MAFEQGTGTKMIGSKQTKEFDLIWRRAHPFDGYGHAGGNPRAIDLMLRVRADWIAKRAENYSLDDTSNSTVRRGQDDSSARMPAGACRNVPEGRPSGRLGM
jgi:hypothetical protein